MTFPIGPLVIHADWCAACSAYTDHVLRRASMWCLRCDGYVMRSEPHAAPGATGAAPEGPIGAVKPAEPPPGAAQRRFRVPRQPSTTTPSEDEAL